MKQCYPPATFKSSPLRPKRFYSLHIQDHMCIQLLYIIHASNSLTMLAVEGP